MYVAIYALWQYMQYYKTANIIKTVELEVFIVFLKFSLERFHFTSISSNIYLDISFNYTSLNIYPKR